MADEIMDALSGAPTKRRRKVRGLEVVDGGKAPRDDRRRVVFYRPENLSAHVAEVESTLAAAGDVYSRGGALVRVAGVEEPRVVSFTAATLRARLSESVVVTASSGAVRIPDDLTRAVLESRTWPVPELAGILETPFLRPDGSVCTASGFDRATGYYLAPGLTIAVPEAPTQADAVAALAELEEVFADFPHVSRAHRMVPIAAVLTLLARPAIRGSVPGFLFDAATRGSGKSLQTDAVSIIATGRTSAKMSWPSLPEELEKVLAAYALRGANIVNFDNVSSGFGGAALDRCLTSVDTVELRVLGRTELPTVPWRAVILASGNNIAVTGDTTRRVLVCRSESPLENPEERVDFAHPELLRWVAQHRARLVRAALVVLRAYHAASRPRDGVRPWGSFESWAGLVPGAILHAGGADVSACRAEQAASPDPEKMALSAVLSHWGRLGPITAKRAIEALYPAERRGPPDGFGDLREAIESVTNARPGMPPSARSLAFFLAKVRGRVVDGRRLAGTLDRKDVMVWTVEDCRVAGFLPGSIETGSRQENSRDIISLHHMPASAGTDQDMSRSRARAPATLAGPETSRQKPALFANHAEPLAGDPPGSSGEPGGCFADLLRPDEGDEP